MSEQRQSMLQTQEALMQALIAGQPAPHGFESAYISRAAATLTHKRAAVVTRCHPFLARMMAQDFPNYFHHYASTHKLNADADGVLDGYTFAFHLLSTPLHHLTRLRILRYLLTRAIANFHQLSLCRRALIHWLFGNR